MAPDGAALVAAVVGPRSAKRLIIARRRPGEALATIAQTTLRARTEVVPAAAVAPGGSGVVAWTEHTYERPGARVAVRSARFTAGADVAPPPVDLLERARVEDEWVQLLVVAGADAAGGATVAWTSPRPAQRRGRVTGLTAVNVANAAPELPLGTPQRLSEDVQDVFDLALSVARDGRALLAHDGTRGAGRRRGRAPHRPPAHAQAALLPFRSPTALRARLLPSALAPRRARFSDGRA